MAKPVISVKMLKDQRETVRAQLNTNSNRRAQLGIRMAAEPESVDRLRPDLVRLDQDDQYCRALLEGIEFQLSEAPKHEAEYRAVHAAAAQKLTRAEELLNARALTLKSLVPQIQALGVTLDAHASQSKELYALCATAAGSISLDLQGHETFDLQGHHTGISSSFETLLWKAGIGDRGIYLPQVTPNNVTDVPFEQAVDRVTDGARRAVERLMRAVDHD